MATRTRIPPWLKTELVQEAGRKCANPGCAHWRTHIHHIKHWQVYKTHAPEHMIAVCPTCHDEIHHGGGISDDELYAWKGITREGDKEVITQMFIEPSNDIRVLTGSMSVTTDGGAAVFTLSNSNTFQFRVTGDNDLFVANASIKNLSGRYLVRAFDNYFKMPNDKAIQIEQRPGRLRVTVLAAKDYLPAWTFPIMWRALPDFIDANRVTAFELDVVRPGVVRLQGTFVANDAVFTITPDKIYVLRPELNGPVAFVGEGERTEIRVSGPITRAAFKL